MNEKLDKFNNNIRNKKVAIIGAGVSNLPLISYLNELGCNVTLFDKKEITLMDENVQEIINNANIKCFTGDNYLDNLEGFDYIFRSPSMLPTNEFLLKEQDRGAIVTTEVEQVIKLAPCKIIGVTGSKGKTTTTTIINNILTNLGYHTYLGGNIGVPLFTKLSEMERDDIIVLELSSFQLMNMRVSPDVAVVTNITPDHLDIHSSYQEYIDAKKYIFKNQTPEDTLVLNKDDVIVSKSADEALGKIKYFSSSKIRNCYVLNDNYIEYNDTKVINTNNLLLKGKHNYLNICAGLNAINALIALDNDKLEDIVKKIKSVPHRLEFVREINGVKWYNDSASTTPDKAIAGIKAFSSNVVLIAGGYDKNIPYESLVQPILDNVSKLILFGDTKNKIYDAVMKEKRKIDSSLQIYVMDTLEEVVDVAYRVSIPGEIVLFSPASASFDMFKNAYQRGDIFKNLVNKI
jgi:UDP-N-acetylmuramoylalanine--D-glutamate ligase